MATTPMKLWQGQPSTAAATEYTVPASTTAIIKNIVLCNTTATAATVTLYMVTSGGTPGVANAIVYSYNVNPNDTIVIDGSFVMGAGDFLAAVQATASAITVTVSGVQVV